MVETDAMRASDRDRQDVVDRLRGAVGDGRLRMDEYMERMEARLSGGHRRRPGAVVRGPAAGWGSGSGAEAGCAWRSAGDGDGRPALLCCRADGVRGAASRDAAGAVVDMADRRAGERRGLGAGQRHDRAPALSMAAVGGRALRRGAVRALGRRVASDGGAGRDRSRCRDRARIAQDIRNQERGRFTRPRCPRRGGCRPPRCQRRRQDDDRRVHPGAAPTRTRGRCECSVTTQAPRRASSGR